MGLTVAILQITVPIFPYRFFQKPSIYNGFRHFLGANKKYVPTSLREQTINF